MAEGLAAIGLAGNIIQFISFSFVLLSKSRELRQSVSGALNEHVDLTIVSQDISALSSRLTLNAASPSRLCNIAERCNIIAEELLDAVSGLQHKQHGTRSAKSTTRWQSFRKALKFVWGKAHIEELQARLELLRNQVTMHLVSDTNDNQIQLIDLLEDWKKKNIQTGYGITSQIQALDSQLQATQKRISALHCDAFWKKLHDRFCQLSSEVHRASQCHMIIASLRYECMHIRQSAIRDAHQRTFAWMYNNSIPDIGASNSDIRFAQWLQHGSGIYWITGKPGSGKSTLMKHLYEHDETIRTLQVWSGNVPLVRACFYFWSPGQQMQKSLEGLLQTLLYHVLYACPELAPTICPERWNAEPQPHDITLPKPWNLSELQRAFALFRAQSTVNTRFYFQIDGLDEYYGDSWDVIETLKDLSSTPNVKLCLSSRPWNCFQDSFGMANANVLRLHDFTRPDIELFARENLLSYDRTTDLEPNLFDDLIHDIGERAQGVFLWVRLVVKSLRNGMINEDPVSLLQERLRAIPSDLEEFFEHILGSVERIYRSRMAGTFLAAMRSPRQLKLIHYYFLEQGNTTFGFEMPSKRWRHSSIQKRATQTERRLNGRFKGLLEAASPTDAELENERTRPFHTACGLNCDIIRFAASIGYANYLSYRMHKDGSVLDLNCILKHAIACPQLFELGVDPNFVVNGASNWISFADEVTISMDGRRKDQCWTVLEMFLEQGVDVNMAISSWISMLTRIDATLEDNLRTTLRYFKRLFSRGLNPNATLRGTTLSKAFLRTLASDSLHLPTASQRIKHEILREFLRYGADISVVYNDRTPDGWLTCVCQELATGRSSSKDLLIPRIEQYRILLEHALDPNVVTHGDRTLWEVLLEAMRNGVQQSVHDIEFKQLVRDMLHLSLQYGADHYVPGIPQLLIVAMPIALFSDDELADLDRALQREDDYRECRAKSQYIHPSFHTLATGTAGRETQT
ncbi:hypothetical protein BKA58DRAFT_413238 [Alternaria rosae]|uniref:uncharacterized protein n=1 Tax=Alternaria rosae TaxID=1187941 RepID=UPI001E8E5D0B|nr:uncharacterized protein BKA58DRAFT_413238 [Alternaria rosae]KAH6865513.1 hypothetical protein BKA58DRAFT_413238 [Alternaria rosae]